MRKNIIKIYLNMNTAQSNDYLNLISSPFYSNDTPPFACINISNPSSSNQLFGHLSNIAYDENANSQNQNKIQEKDEKFALSEKKRQRHSTTQMVVIGENYMNQIRIFYYQVLMQLNEEKFLSQNKKIQKYKFLLQQFRSKFMKKNSINVTNSLMDYCKKAINNRKRIYIFSKKLLGLITLSNKKVQFLKYIQIFINHDFLTEKQFYELIVSQLAFDNNIKLQNCKNVQRKIKKYIQNTNQKFPISRQGLVQKLQSIKQFLVYDTTFSCQIVPLKKPQEQKKIETGMMTTIHQKEDKQKIENKFEAQVTQLSKQVKKIENKFEAQITQLSKQVKKMENKFEAQLNIVTQQVQKLNKKIDQRR